MQIASADILAIVGGLVSAGTLLYSLYSLAAKIGALTLKVETMWDFTLRRAQSEAVASGGVMMASGTLSDQGRSWIEPVMPQIRAYYDGGGRVLKDSDLAMEIERRFGNELLNQVCVPRGLYMGACLVILIKALRQG